MAKKNSNLGHFGLPAVLLAALGIALLVVHLAVPYAHVDYANKLSAEENDAVADDSDGFTLAQRDNWFRGDINELYDQWEWFSDTSPGTYEPTKAASPGATLAGIILVMVAGLALFVLGFIPLGVSTARWIGWGGGALAVVGGTLAFFSSMFWVGSGFGHLDAFVAQGGVTGGFTGLMEKMAGTDNAGDAWIIGPAIVAALAVVVIVYAFKLVTSVTPKKDGLRDNARQHIRSAHWGLAFLALALVVPYAMAEVPEFPENADDPHFGYMLEGGEFAEEVPEDELDRDYVFVGAHTVLVGNELTKVNKMFTAGDPDVEGKQWWNGLSMSLRVFFAAGWIGILAGLLGTLRGILATTPAPKAITRIPEGFAFATAAMLIWTFVSLILVLSTQWKPHASANYDWDPAWAPFAILPLLVMWAWSIIVPLRGLLGIQTAPKASARGRGKAA